MKYVAYIDTLGFKQRINSISHEEAVEVINNFNSAINNLWTKSNLHIGNSVRARTFSDSIIIHSESDSLDELDKIINFIIELYKVSIIQCNLPLRGGIAFGEFDDFKAVESNNLQKGLIVGTAFIEAYLLESSNQIKGSKIMFGQEVNLSIEKLQKNYHTQKVKNDKDGNEIFELKWGNIVYLKENNYQALNKYIDLATKSKWIDHYFGTLETFLIKESTVNKKEIFVHIIEKLKQDFKYNELDNFIENYIKSENAKYTKISFLAFIRERL